MLERVKNRLSNVWVEIKQGNPFQALKAFFGFSTKRSHVAAKLDEPTLPRVVTPALTRETIMEVGAGIAASKEALEEKRQAALARRRETSWKPVPSAIIEETGKELGMARRAEKRSAKAFEERRARQEMEKRVVVEEERRLAVETKQEPTRPKTKEEQSAEDKAKAAARKAELQERSRSAEARKKAAAEKTSHKKGKSDMTAEEAQNFTRMLPILAMMSLATPGEEAVVTKETTPKPKAPKKPQPKKQFAKTELQRGNAVKGGGRNKHR